MRDLWRIWTAILMVCLLSACGGGGGTVSPPPVANAGTAQSVMVGTTATLDGSGSSAASGSSLAYAWRIAAAPDGSTAALVHPDTSAPTLTPDRAGNYTLALVVSDGKASSSEATVTVTAFDSGIVVDAPEPVAGTVHLSLDPPVSGAVTWYVDQRLLGTGSTVSGSPIAWITTTTTNGTHLVTAAVQTSPTTSHEVRRNIMVSNPSVTVTAAVTREATSSFVNARASSVNGIAQVSATVDGRPLGTLTAPNACNVRDGCGVQDIYRFQLLAASYQSGTHTVVVTATDGAGSSQQVTVAVPISNAPTLAVNAPPDGSILFGSLQLSGTASTDKGSTVTVTVTARLGDVQFLSTSSPSFAASYDLSGLPAGAYTLTVQATDSQAQVTELVRHYVVASSQALAYTPLFTLPDQGEILAIEGNKLLYSSNGSVRVRNMDTGSEVMLAGTLMPGGGGSFQLSGGMVYASGTASDCASFCIYQWLPDGTRRNLSNANPASRAANIVGGVAYDMNPVAKDGYVLWVNDHALDASGVGSGRYTLYQVATGTYTRIDAPAGTDLVGNIRYDFAVAAGTVRFDFWARTTGSGPQSRFDVFQWQSDTGATVQLSSGSMSSIYPQTDAARIAWQEVPIGGSGTFTLRTRAVSGGAISAPSTNAADFMLADGVLAWTENLSTVPALRADAAGTTTTLAASGTPALLADRGGRVAYSQSGKLQTWDSATGTATLRVDAVPQTVLLGPGMLVFRIGSSIYRVPL